MTQHKWHKEIKAWADGAEIEMWYPQYDGWGDCINPMFDINHIYRIKPKVKITGRVASNTWLEEHEVRIEALEKIVSPQPKEPQYLYVYKDYGELCLLEGEIQNPAKEIKYIGKIKLEVDDVGTT
jgi:hypothetical protein